MEVLIESLGVNNKHRKFLHLIVNYLLKVNRQDHYLF